MSFLTHHCVTLGSSCKLVETLFKKSISFKVITQFWTVKRQLLTSGINSASLEIVCRLVKKSFHWTWDSKTNLLHFTKRLRNIPTMSRLLVLKNEMEVEFILISVITYLCIYFYFSFSAKKQGHDRDKIRLLILLWGPRGSLHDVEHICGLSSGTTTIHKT